MKYGEHLIANIAPEYGPEPYLKYRVLHDIIEELSARAPSSAILESRQVSLTTPPQTNAQGLAQSDEMPTEENFLKVLDEEMVKVEAFTLQKVTELRQKLKAVETILQQQEEEEEETGSKKDVLAKQRADEIADDFLRLEKYVNINFMGFHKILKKHDKWLPNNPCKGFYINRLHTQAWVRGDYSDLVVRLSHIYTVIRGGKQDSSGSSNSGSNNNMEANTTTTANTYDYDNNKNKQDFIKGTTTKYWIKTEDVSRVKYAILRHLPLQSTTTTHYSTTDESTTNPSSSLSDSQFTNSVYLDNDQLELYHGRLDNTLSSSLSGDAIELRLRWYGPNDPKTVFVERKKHTKTRTGEVSVKEGFMIEESEVNQILTNTYPIEQKKQEMLNDGKKSVQEIEEWETLIREVTQVISSKQLIPTIRTQSMRTSFQIPFDPTVRIGLDTNLCMIDERGYVDNPDDQQQTTDDNNNNNTKQQQQQVWRRDPSWGGILKPNEIHRFPHAVLEIQLQMPRTTTATAQQQQQQPRTPHWVTDLQNSGWLYECHKYSKYVHGCSVLLPDDVCSVPYWVDDISLKESIVASGAKRILLLDDDDVSQQQQQQQGAGGVGGTTKNVESTTNAANDNNNNSKQGQDNNDNFSGETTPLLGGGGGGAAGGSGGTSGGEVDNNNNRNNTGGGNHSNNHYHHANDDDYGYDNNTSAVMCCGGWMFQFCSRNNNIYDSVVVPTSSIQKIEPKVFMANERTFLHWLHYAVILASIASGILSYSETKEQESLSNNAKWAIYYAMMLLPISLGFCMYALHIFLWRTDRITTGIPGRWDDPRGPLVLGGIVAVALTVNFFSKIYEIATFTKSLGLEL